MMPIGSVFFMLLNLFCFSTLYAETTFLANFNQPELAGSARFMPDYNVGTGVIPSVVRTGSAETVDLPVGMGPTLDAGIRVHSGAAALDLRGGRDGLFYTNLAAGNINRAEGTAEGFFRTPYPLAGNGEPRALFSAWVSFKDGSRWFWQVDAEGDRLVARLGDDSLGGGSVVLEGLPLDPAAWKENKWHHVVLTWKINPGSDDDLFQLFVDGRLVGRVANGRLPVTPAIEEPVGNRIYIGMSSGGTGGLNSGQGANLEGWIDSVRFDDTVLYDGSGFAVGNRVFTPPAAESWRSLGVFDSPSMTWQPAGGEPAAPALFDHRSRGSEFTCDFAKVADRCYWEAATALDLSGGVSLIGWIYAANAAAIESVNIHLKSGGGWYNTTILVAEGWNAFAVNMAHFGVQGTPSGLDRIDTVRISAWKRRSGSGLSKVTFYDLESSMQPARERPFEYPEYDISAAPGRPVTRDPGTKAHLESRVIMDEAPYFLLEGTNAVLDKIAQAGFNVYMPCVWHGRGAIYRSDTSIPDRQYASKFGGTLDPFAELIEAAHARGIEVHGWFTVGLREIDIYPEFAEPGTPADAFDLQNPAFRDFIVNEIIGFVKTYNVDGINLDYIRTKGTSFSPTASALYLQRFGVSIQELKQSPISLDAEARFLAWQRDAVSDVVRRVKEGIRNIKPKVVISVSGYPTEKPTLHEEGRNEWLWVENGWVDLVYMMAYDPSPDLAQLKNVRRSSPFPERFTMLPGNYGGTVDGKVIPREADLVMRQVDYFLRKFPDAGIGVYLYSMLSWEQSVALREGPFKEGAVPYWGKIKNLAMPNRPQNVTIR